MNKKRILTLCCMASLVAGLFGICAGSNGTAKIRTLNVKKGFSVKMKVGETIRIKPKKAQTDTIKFRSDNKRVAIVNSKGYIKAKKTGNAKITAKNPKIQIVGKIKVVKNNCIQSEITSPVKAEEIKAPTESAAVPVQTETYAPVNSSNTAVPEGTPMVTSSPEQTESPFPKDKLRGDIFLNFVIDQEKIYTDTTHLTGSMTQCRDCILIISCGEDIIQTIDLEDNVSTLDFDVDFSGYKAGDDVCIALKFIGKQIPHFPVWNTYRELHYVLLAPGQTPAPGTPEPSHSPESTYEPRI